MIISGKYHKTKGLEITKATSINQNHRSPENDSNQTPKDNSGRLIGEPK